MMSDGAVLLSADQVRVRFGAFTAVKDVSDANFKVVGSLTLTAPNGGESWAVSTSKSVIRAMRSLEPLPPR